MEAKGLREPSLDVPRRGAEVKDDDPIIPFGPQPTVSRFGAISRTSKTGYQTTGPVQAMASTSPNPNSKHMTMPGKQPCVRSVCIGRKLKIDFFAHATCLFHIIVISHSVCDKTFLTAILLSHL